MKMRLFFLISALILLIIMFPLSALSNSSNDLVVTGLVGKLHSVSVSQFADSMPIDLDYSVNNNLLITPTATPVSEPGLKIATWSMTTNSLPATMVISHDRIVNTLNNTISYDYELAVEYQLDSSAANVVQIAIAGNQIEIQLNDAGAGLYSVQDAGMFFRLCKVNGIIGSNQIQDGEYRSNVTFNFIGT